MPIWSEDFASSYAQLAASATPVLFVWGDDDCVVPLDESYELLRHLFAPRASCLVVPGGGHGLIVEDADIVSLWAWAWVSDTPDAEWHRHLHDAALSCPTTQDGSAVVLGSSV